MLCLISIECSRLSLRAHARARVSVQFESIYWLIEYKTTGMEYCLIKEFVLCEWGGVDWIQHFMLLYTTVDISNAFNWNLNFANSMNVFNQMDCFFFGMMHSHLVPMLALTTTFTLILTGYFGSKCLLRRNHIFVNLSK